MHKRYIIESRPTYNVALSWRPVQAIEPKKRIIGFGLSNGPFFLYDSAQEAFDMYDTFDHENFARMGQIELRVSRVNDLSAYMRKNLWGKRQIKAIQWYQWGHNEVSNRLNNLMLDACEKEIARLDKQVLDLQAELLASVKKTALCCMKIHDDCGDDAVQEMDRIFKVSTNRQEEMFKNEE